MKRKFKSKRNLPAKYIYIVLMLACILVLYASLALGAKGSFMRKMAGYVVAPMQSGINRIGSSMANSMENLRDAQAVRKENLELKEKVQELTQELNTIKLDQYELDNLRQLLELDKKYANYNKLAANVIGKDPGNWFSVFTIDKGAKDGIKVNMNVIAGNGLAGIVTEVGNNYSIVRSIVDDRNNVAAMVISTNDFCVVNGDLKTMTSDQKIRFSELHDADDATQVGDQIVTSQLSDKYMPGIMIGYISEIKKDSNNLTKSGTITPVVDFEHIQEVFVILDQKELEK